MDLQYSTLSSDIAEEHVILISERHSTRGICKRTESFFCVLCCVVLWFRRDHDGPASYPTNQIERTKAASLFHYYD